MIGGDLYPRMSTGSSRDSGAYWAPLTGRYPSQWGLTTQERSRPLVVPGKGSNRAMEEYSWPNRRSRRRLRSIIKTCLLYTSDAADDM
eukprot:8919087-Alexandrium_andersonii.AAC.1